MTDYDPRQLSIDMRDALVKAARVVGDNFYKEMNQVAPEYKDDSAKSVRTVIDINAERIMKSHMVAIYPRAIYQLEEEGADGVGDLERTLLIFGDPFDGTANKQPRLGLSTQGLMAAQ